jgi:hypothetical protein
MIDGGTLPSRLLAFDMADHEKEAGRVGGTNDLGFCRFSSFSSLELLILVESTMVFSLEMAMQHMSFSMGEEATVRTTR